MATILIVDECPENRKLFAAPLEHQGHRLLETCGGADAMALVRGESPHLIIVDSRGPLADGLEVVLHLRSDLDSTRIPLILYSDRGFQREAIALSRVVDVPSALPTPEEVVRTVDLALSQREYTAKLLGSSGRRIDREHSRRSPNLWRQGAAEFARMTAENERLRAELMCRAEELSQEVAKRKQAEQTLMEIQNRHLPALRASNDTRLQALFDNALDAILWTDDEKRFMDANPAACQMLEYSRDELLAMNVFDITPPQDRAIAEDLWQRLRAVGKLRGEYTVICKSGATREVEHRAVADALPGLHLSLMHDITQRKRAERETRDSEERFRQLAEHIGEVFWMNDTEHSRVIYVSPSYEKTWGRTRESLYVSPRSWTETVHPEDRDRVIEAADAIRTQAPYDQTYRIVRPDGSFRWIRDRAFPVYDTAGNLIRIAGIAQDITDRKRAEEALSESVQRSRILTRRVVEAQENERRRISRELHDEIGQALVLTKVSLEAVSRTVNDLASSTQHTMATVENTVRQVRRLSLDLRPPMLDDLGLAAALRGYCDRQAQGAGFALDVEVEPIIDGLSPEIETACFRVAKEAMTNIVRHARPQHVRIELRQREADLQLRVHDDGIGFDVAAARQRAMRGESLGLLGMEERVKLLGGRIDIESAPDHGTELRACFPMRPAT